MYGVVMNVQGSTYGVVRKMYGVIMNLFRYLERACKLKYVVPCSCLSFQVPLRLKRGVGILSAEDVILGVRQRPDHLP